MTHEHDVVLQGLFNEAERDLEGAEFTRTVVRRTYGLMIRLVLVAGGASVVFLAVMLALGLSPLVVAQSLSGLLTVSLLELGEGWTAWVLSPVNSIGGALILGAKAVRMLYTRIRRMC